MLSDLRPLQESSSSIPDGLEEDLEDMMEQMNMHSAARENVRLMSTKDKQRMVALYKERPATQVSLTPLCTGTTSILTELIIIVCIACRALGRPAC